MEQWENNIHYIEEKHILDDHLKSNEKILEDIDNYCAKQWESKSDLSKSLFNNNFNTFVNHHKKLFKEHIDTIKHNLMIIKMQYKEYPNFVKKLKDKIEKGSDKLRQTNDVLLLDLLNNRVTIEELNYYQVHHLLFTIDTL
jgi:hypothetical protein